jgi:hypothetical protein
MAKPKVIVKYIPRSFYEEQMTDDEKLGEYYKSMFEDTQPNMYNPNNNKK